MVTRDWLKYQSVKRMRQSSVILVASKFSGESSLLQNSNLPQSRLSLHLHLFKSVLPNGGERSDTVLAEIHQNVHAFVVHRLAHVDIIVSNVCTQLLQGRRSAGLELLGLLLAALLGFQRVVESFYVG